MVVDLIEFEIRDVYIKFEMFDFIMDIMLDEVIVLGEIVIIKDGVIEDLV